MNNSKYIEIVCSCNFDFKSSNNIPPRPLKKSSKSFRKRAKRKGDKFSPWRTPEKHGKKSECCPLSLTQDFMLLYILWITLKHLPLIP